MCLYSDKDDNSQEQKQNSTSSVNINDTKEYILNFHQKQYDIGMQQRAKYAL